MLFRTNILYPMKLRQILHFYCAALVALFAYPLQAGVYKNPVIAEDAPDPSVIRGNDGYYYLFSTAEHVYRSSNLTKWTYLRQVFDGGKRPTFVEGVNTYWAPCVTKQDGRYVMYFALSTWGGGDTASIGVATADKPEGPYTIVGDGKLFTSGEVGVHNSIDPNYIEYNGKKYIVWGSWNGIWLIELTADGLAVKDIKTKTQIAGTRFEAPYIYRRGRFFYLFCSIGACCEGANSTYETIVGRSRSLFGPYVTKNNKKLMDNNYELFLTSNTPCIAPGHNSRIIEDEEGKTWMTYHGYMRTNPTEGRVVWLDEVKWENDWPYIEGTGASSESLEGPVVTPYSLDVDEIHTEWGVNQGVLQPADLTNEGKMSLIVAGSKADSQSAPKPWTAIVRQNDKGVWAEAENGLQAGPNPTVVPADFNGDGQMDILLLSSPHETANPDGSANGIYFIQPDNTFQKGNVMVEGADFSELTAAAVADVNRDGNLDIVAVGPQGKNLVLIAPSSLDASSSYTTASLDFHAVPFAGADNTFSQVFTADFNADGIADFFAYSSTAAELFLGDGAGAFVPTNWSATCPIPTDGGVAIADVNQDGAFDIICTAEVPISCLNDGTGHFQPASSVFDLGFKNTYCSTASANLFDWDGNGCPDFFYQGENATLAVTTGAIWYGSVSGPFKHKYRYGAGASAATTFLDWDGDGVADLITSGTNTDAHLFPFATGRLLSVTLNPNATSERLLPPTYIESNVNGNTVHLSWSQGQKNHTYEVYVCNDEGRLFGNVRAYTDKSRSGKRKVLDHGNCGTAVETEMNLPAGHYTWGVQRVNTRFEGSAFRTKEFTVSADGVVETPTTTTTIVPPTFYNVLGQQVPASHRGFQLVRYPDGRVRKTF